MPENPAAFNRLRTLLNACEVTPGDIQGRIMTRLGQVHRKQEKRIFASEGGEGRHGTWPRLNPAYLARKRAAGYTGKILVRKGDMKKAFTLKNAPGYLQFYRKPVASFGAASDVAGFHFRGGGRLPRRDPVSKTENQIEEMRLDIASWWINERVPQILRGAISLPRSGGAA